MTNGALSRRGFLRAGATVMATGATSAACGGGGSKSLKARKAVEPPAHVPYTGVHADLPATSGGVPPGFFHYPANPPRFIKGTVGNGGSVSALLQGTSIGVPAGRNRWWQNLNKALNAQLKFTIAASADYSDKLQVTLSGGDLPDIVQITPTQVPQLPQVMDKEFADLSEYLSGDAIKDYPALAAISPQAWKSCSVNGRIFGTPQARPVSGMVLSTRQDLLDKMGIKPPQLTSGKEFIDLCKELSDPKHSKWAIGSDPVGWSLQFMLEMMGAPNGWKVENGKFISVNETEQMKAALDQVHQMWKMQLLHPDSFSLPASNINWWIAGTTYLYLQDFTGWASYSRAYPDIKIGAIAPPKWSGGGLARKRLGVGAYGAFTSYKKAKPERVKEMLRIANYIAAPFGTKEYMTVNFGVPGVDYTMKDGNAVLTKQGIAESQLPYYYISSANYSVLYVAGQSELVRQQYDYLKKVIPGGVQNPTLGLYSETANTTGVSANKTLSDMQASIIAGREPLSKWDQAVKNWRTQAGDKMAREYEKAYAASH